MKIIAEKRQTFVETIVQQFGLHFNKLVNALLWINQYEILYLNLVFYSTQSCIKALSSKSD